LPQDGARIFRASFSLQLSVHSNAVRVTSQRGFFGLAEDREDQSGGKDEKSDIYSE